MDDFNRWRVFVTKGVNGLGIGIEEFLRKEHPLRDSVYKATGSNVIRFASIFIPYNNGEELSLRHGYRTAIKYIDSVTEEGRPVLIGVDSAIIGKKFINNMRKQAYGRLMRFRAIPPQHRKSEEALGLGAVKRETTIEEVLWNAEGK